MRRRKQNSREFASRASAAFSEALIQLLALAVMAENVDAVDLRVPVTVEPGVEGDRRRNGSNRRET